MIPLVSLLDINKINMIEMLAVKFTEMLLCWCLKLDKMFADRVPIKWEYPAKYWQVILVRVFADDGLVSKHKGNLMKTTLSGRMENIYVYIYNKKCPN